MYNAFSLRQRNESSQQQKSGLMIGPFQHVTDVLDGHLLSSDVAWRAAAVHGSVQGAGCIRQGAQADVEARYILLQRTRLLPAHNHRAKQAAQDQTGRLHTLLHEVCARIVYVYIYGPHVQALLYTLVFGSPRYVSAFCCQVFSTIYCRCACRIHVLLY